MFIRTKRVGQYEYLRIVENGWRDGRTPQSLGSVEQLRASGALVQMAETLS